MSMSLLPLVYFARNLFILSMTCFTVINLWPVFCARNLFMLSMTIVSLWFICDLFSDWFCHSLLMIYFHHTLFIERAQSQGHHTIDRLGGERRRKRKRSTIFLERTRKGHRQSDQHWNCFKGNTGETPEKRGGAHMGLPERVDTILNWIELNCL